jgi:hypothetical protein
MSTYQSDPVTQRLDRLERENWYWKRATLLLVIVIGAAILMGQATKPHLIEGQIVKAQSIEIIDNEGKTRASLSYDEYVEGGGVKLKLKSRNTETGAELEVNDYAATLRLKSRQKYTPRDEQTLNEHTKKLNAVKTPEDFERILSDSERVQGTRVFLAAARSSKETDGTAVVRLYGERASTIELTDQKGAKAILGNTDLEYPYTGKKEKRPASSLVLFDKYPKVFWTTP